MKRKNVLILYVFGNDIASISKREATFHALQTKMVDEGRTVVREQRDTRGRTVVFNDNSQLMLYAFGTQVQGHRLTHLFVDKESLSLPNSHHYIEKCAIPALIGSTTTYKDMDVQESVEERVAYFEYTSQRELNFEPFFHKD